MSVLNTHRLFWSLFRTQYSVRTIYIVSGIVSNLEMISGLWEAVPRLHTNTAASSVTDLSVEELVPMGMWNQSPEDIK